MRRGGASPPLRRPVHFRWIAHVQRHALFRRFAFLSLLILLLFSGLPFIAEAKYTSRTHPDPVSLIFVKGEGATELSVTSHYASLPSTAETVRQQGLWSVGPIEKVTLIGPASETPRMVITYKERFAAELGMEERRVIYEGELKERSGELRLILRPPGERRPKHTFTVERGVVGVDGVTGTGGGAAVDATPVSAPEGAPVLASLISDDADVAVVDLSAASSADGGCLPVGGRDGCGDIACGETGIDGRTCVCTYDRQNGRATCEKRCEGCPVTLPLTVVRGLPILKIGQGPSAPIRLSLVEEAGTEREIATGLLGNDEAKDILIVGDTLYLLSASQLFLYTRDEGLTLTKAVDLSPPPQGLSTAAILSVDSNLLLLRGGSDGSVIDLLSPSGELLAKTESGPVAAFAFDTAARTLFLQGDQVTAVTPSVDRLLARTMTFDPSPGSLIGADGAILFFSDGAAVHAVRVLPAGTEPLWSEPSIGTRRVVTGRNLLLFVADDEARIYEATVPPAIRHVISLEGMSGDIEEAWLVGPKLVIVTDTSSYAAVLPAETLSFATTHTGLERRTVPTTVSGSSPRDDLRAELFINVRVVDDDAVGASRPPADAAEPFLVKLWFGEKRDGQPFLDITDTPCALEGARIVAEIAAKSAPSSVIPLLLSLDADTEERATECVFLITNPTTMLRDGTQYELRFQLFDAGGVPRSDVAIEEIAFRATPPGAPAPTAPSSSSLPVAVLGTGLLVSDGVGEMTVARTGGSTGGTIGGSPGGSVIGSVGGDPCSSKGAACYDPAAVGGCEGPGLRPFDASCFDGLVCCVEAMAVDGCGADGEECCSFGCAEGLSCCDRGTGVPVCSSSCSQEALVSAAPSGSVVAMPGGIRATTAMGRIVHVERDGRPSNLQPAASQPHRTAGVRDEEREAVVQEIRDAIAPQPRLLSLEVGDGSPRQELEGGAVLSIKFAADGLEPGQHLVEAYLDKVDASGGVLHSIPIMSGEHGVDEEGVIAVEGVVPLTSYPGTYKVRVVVKRIGGGTANHEYYWSVVGEEGEQHGLVGISGDELLSRVASQDLIVEPLPGADAPSDIPSDVGLSEEEYVARLNALILARYDYHQGRSPVKKDAYDRAIRSFLEGYGELLDIPPGVLPAGSLVDDFDAGLSVFFFHAQLDHARSFLEQRVALFEERWRLLETDDAFLLQARSMTEELDRARDASRREHEQSSAEKGWVGKTLSWVNYHTVQRLRDEKQAVDRSGGYLSSAGNALKFFWNHPVGSLFQMTDVASGGDYSPTMRLIGRVEAQLKNDKARIADIGRLQASGAVPASLPSSLHPLQLAAEYPAYMRSLAEESYGTAHAICYQEDIIFDASTMNLYDEQLCESLYLLATDISVGNAMLFQGSSLDISTFQRLSEGIASDLKVMRIGSIGIDLINPTMLLGVGVLGTGLKFLQGAAKTHKAWQYLFQLVKAGAVALPVYQTGHSVLSCWNHYIYESPEGREAYDEVAGSGLVYKECVGPILMDGLFIAPIATGIGKPLVMSIPSRMRSGVDTVGTLFGNSRAWAGTRFRSFAQQARAAGTRGVDWTARQGTRVSEGVRRARTWAGAQAAEARSAAGDTASRASDAAGQRWEQSRGAWREWRGAKERTRAEEAARAERVRQDSARRQREEASAREDAARRAAEERARAEAAGREAAEARAAADRAAREAESARARAARDAGTGEWRRVVPEEESLARLDEPGQSWMFEQGGGRSSRMTEHLGFKRLLELRRAGTLGPQLQEMLDKHFAHMIKSHLSGDKRAYKQAFRKAMTLFHPDKIGMYDGVSTQQLQEASRVLTGFDSYVQRFSVPPSSTGLLSRWADLKLPAGAEPPSAWTAQKAGTRSARDAAAAEEAARAAKAKQAAAEKAQRDAEARRAKADEQAKARAAADRAENERVAKEEAARRARQEAEAKAAQAKAPQGPRTGDAFVRANADRLQRRIATEGRGAAYAAEIREAFDRFFAFRSRENAAGLRHELFSASRGYTVKDMMRDVRSGVLGGTGRDPVRIGEVVFIPRASKVFVVGDIHGDARTLERIIVDSRFIERRLAGEDVQMVFLGDFVDRGPDAIEALLHLLALKTHPDVRVRNGVTILRGNHEAFPDRQLFDYWERYGFFDEMMGKVGPEQAERYATMLKRLFDDLPLMAFTEDAAFVHAGLPVMPTSDPRIFARNKEAVFQRLVNGETFRGGPVQEGTLEWSMLWGDVKNVEGVIDDGRISIGVQVWRDFMESVGVSRLFRGHQEMYVKINGQKKSMGAVHTGSVGGGRDVTTVFSSNEYHGGNRGWAEYSVSGNTVASHVYTAGS